MEFAINSFKMKKIYICKKIDKIVKKRTTIIYDFGIH